MNEELKLKILRQNLQQINTSNDDFLKNLLLQAQANILREGIKEEESDDYEMAVIDYAAFLFRKRAMQDMIMPKNLRYTLNNILMSQKAKKNDI